MRIHSTITALFCCFSLALFSQNAIIEGTIQSAESQKLTDFATILLQGTDIQTQSASDGSYRLENIPPGDYIMSITSDGMAIEYRQVDLKTAQVLNLNIKLQKEQKSATDDFPVISIEDADQGSGDAADVSGILRAGRDVFQNATAFNLFAFRFAERGYGSQLSPLFLNGVRMNDPELGWVSFSEFGGLNDVLRNRSTTIGMDPADFTFGDVGGTANIDIRASKQRQQIRASYGISNRAYNHRLMLTASTGLNKNGWAFSFSGSRRWANEGYIPGTFYDAWSYFMSVDKRINNIHNLSFTVLGAPTRRGRSGDAFQEQYDLAGTNYFNPRWGYWNDKKRNASVFHNHQPIAMLRHDWTPSTKGSLTTTVFHQQGPRGSSRLDWFDAMNPNADYNRLLPSAQPTPEAEAEWLAYLQADEKNRQIDWTGMYASNSTSNPVSIQNANGFAGNTVTGRWSQYILEDQRQDSRESGANMIFRYDWTNQLSLQGGAEMSLYKGENYRVVEDLLGGDFYMDYDKFAEFDPNRNTDPNQQFYSFNLDNPDNVLVEGDIFGYNYDEYIQQGGIWAQAQYATNKFDFSISGQMRQTGMWRNGNFRHYNYPDESKGKSDVLNFTLPSAKAGIVYKYSNRYYAYANAYIGTRAPLFQDAFLNARVLNRTLPNIEASDVQAFEAGIHIRTPKVKARVTGYLTNFQNETDVQIYFAPTNNVFANLAIQGIDRQHAGVEAAAEWSITPAFGIVAATNISQNVFTSRPTLYFQGDNDTEPIIDGSLAYQEGYFVPRFPQTVGVLTAKYSFKNYMFANLSFNYSDNFWFEFDRLRRTAFFVETIEKDSDLWNTVLDQQKAPAAYTLDFFGGKSWKLNTKTRQYIRLNVGVNNLLDKKDIVTWGRDSYISAFRESSDTRRYASELSYSIGRNYFISLTYQR